MNAPALTFEKIEVKGTPIEQSFSIHKRKGTIKAVLKTFSVKDGDFWVTYIPALNMSGYGSSLAEADEMIKVSMNEYFQTLIESKPTVVKTEMRKYGWTQSLFNKQFSNTTYVDKHGVLKNFNLPEDTPIQESSILVA